MKKLFLIAACALPVLRAPAQSFSWIEYEPVQYNLNPVFTNFGIELDEANSRVYAIYLETGNVTFNLDVYGDVILEARDLSGTKNWDVSFGSKVAAPAVQTDGQGNVYVGGGFMDTLSFGPGQFLVNTGFGFDVNYFIAKFDPAGNLLWSRNLSTTWTDAVSLEDLDADPAGNIWYALTTLSTKRHARITRIDAAGNDVQTRSIQGPLTVGSISFDPWGGLYVSGDTSPGDFVMGSDTFSAPYNYNIYIARYGSDGMPRWAHFGSSVTVVHSQVVADVLGNAYLSGPRYDSLSFGNQHLDAPPWLEHVFVFKTDSMGDFKWAAPSPPAPGTPLGEYTVGRGWHTGVDAQGNVFLAGTQRGTLDWGNNVVVSSPSPAQYNECFVKVGSSGLTQWVKLAGNDKFNVAQSLQVAANGDCYFTSFADDSAYYDNFFVQTGFTRNYIVGKLAPTPTAIDETESPASLLAGPNPSTGILDLSPVLVGGPLTIHAADGRLVYAAGELAATRLDLTHLDNGVYIVSGFASGKAATTRWIKIQ